MPVSLFRRKELPEALAGRSAIIDIGSNSIRLVVYDGPARIPAILFNEKVMAGLGRGLADGGAIDEDAMVRATEALERFKRLAEQMHVGSLRTVATAAVRDAANGADLLGRLAKMGLAVELLTGDQEAQMAGQGVLAAVPNADGVVGDLGGGSLELSRIRDGEVHQTVSFPLGVLRLPAIRAKGLRVLDRTVAAMLAKSGWSAERGLPFYLVGGSWRALARFDMHLTAFPLPIIHHYTMTGARPSQLLRTLARYDKRRLKLVPGLSATRGATLPDAAALLAILSRQLGSSTMIASAFGLREGLLHQSLPAAVRMQDPLICGAREEGRRQGRFPEHGDILDAWLAPVFADESGEDVRLRRAAVLLADIGWRAHPDFRAQRGLETALHGNWVGVDAAGRAAMAHALWVSFGGTGVEPVVEALLPPERIARAARWGLAMRLGQRLSGGVAAPLEAGGLALAGGKLALALAEEDRELYGEAVARRHKALATALGVEPVVVEG